MNGHNLDFYSLALMVRRDATHSILFSSLFSLLSSLYYNILNVYFFGTKKNNKMPITLLAAELILDQTSKILVDVLLKFKISLQISLKISRLKKNNNVRIYFLYYEKYTKILKCFYFGRQ